MARMGIKWATIKWIGRWGSDVLLRYVQEVEAPDGEVAPTAVRALRRYRSPARSGRRERVGPVRTGR